MYKQKTFIRLNFFEHSMMKLGEGLRYAFLVYHMLTSSDVHIEKLKLFCVLTDIETYKRCYSFDMFSEYLFSIFCSSGEFLPSFKLCRNNISLCTETETIKCGKTFVFMELFEYLYSIFWEQIVDYAIDNFEQYTKNFDSYDICSNCFYISFEEYGVLYEDFGIKDKEVICLNFLESVFDFLKYNHIININDFEIVGDYDIKLDIKFNFSYIHP